MGQKMVRFAQLGAARSRQDESMEVGEVGSKRPSSGCNGVHVVGWIGLIFWLLMRLLTCAWTWTWAFAGWHHSQLHGVAHVATSAAISGR